MRKPFVALTLAAALAASHPGFLDQLWSLFTLRWSESSSDAGCGWDPSGMCNPQPEPDEGCGADPLGLCNPQLQPDAGCGFDPLGCPQGS